MNNNNKINSHEVNEEEKVPKQLEKIEFIGFETSSYRFVQIFVYDIAIIVGYSVVNVFPPIDNSIKNGFMASDFMLYYLKTIFYFLEIFINIPILLLIEKFGNRKSLVIGSLLILSGSGLRTLISHSVYLALVGHTIVCLGFQLFQPLIGNLSSMWFPSNERIISIVSADCSYAIANAISYYLPTLIISDKMENAKSEVFDIMLIDFYKCLGLFFVVLMFFKEKPANPLNFSSLIPREGFKNSCKILFFNKDYRNLFIALTIFLGCYFSFMSHLIQLYGSHGYSQNYIGKIGTVMSISGFISKISIILVLRKMSLTKILFTQPLALIACYSLILLSLHSLWVIFLYIFSGFLCFIADSVFPPSQELALRIGFPCDENFSAGVIFTGASLFTTIFNLVFTLVFQLDKIYWTPICFSIIIVGMIISASFYYRVKEINPREKYEVRTLLDQKTDLDGFEIQNWRK